MPLTKKFSALYEDALVALAAASERPASVVNVNGHYAIRVDRVQPLRAGGQFATRFVG